MDLAITNFFALIAIVTMVFADAEDISCKPRATLVATDMRRHVVPQYKSLNRCSGIQSTHSQVTHRCVATITNEVNVQVMDPYSHTISSILLQEDASCECKTCQDLEQICDVQKRKWNSDTCTCEDVETQASSGQPRDTDEVTISLNLYIITIISEFILFVFIYVILRKCRQPDVIYITREAVKKISLSASEAVGRHLSVGRPVGFLPLKWTTLGKKEPEDDVFAV